MSDIRNDRYSALANNIDATRLSLRDDIDAARMCIDTIIASLSARMTMTTSHAEHEELQTQLQAYDEVAQQLLWGEAVFNDHVSATDPTIVQGSEIGSCETG